jgi:hypothetical protein
MNNVSVTVPMEYNALMRASWMLEKMAEDLRSDKPPILEAIDKTASIANAVINEINERGGDSVQVEHNIDVLSGADTAVELDVEGFPHDTRIHGIARKKKATGEWKKIRNIDPEMVKHVECELRAAMAIDASDPFVNNPLPTSNAIADDAAPPPPTTMTFPELLQAITSAQIAPDAVALAVKNVGLPALSLLAARPDLVPAVQAELFVGG